MTFIKNIRMRATEGAADADGNRLREIHNRGDDVNMSFGGQYVWLIPEFTENPLEAMTAVDVFIMEHKDSGRDDDLAVGAGGQYRYLDRIHDNANPNKMVAAALYRNPEPADGKPLPDGWEGKSGDLNRGRGGEYLYIVWKSQKVDN